jgi:hypothetical protein
MYGKSSKMVWLVGATYPSEKYMKVSWDYSSQYIYMDKYKMFQTTNQSKIVDFSSGKTNIANWKITMSNRSIN